METKNEQNEDKKGTLLDILKLVGPFIAIIIIYYLFFA